MIVALFRFLARLLAFLLLALIAVGGIVVAVFCLRGGDATLGLSHLCDLIGLDEFRGTLGDWLGTLEADGPTAALAALCGAGAVLLGLGLLIGALAPSRARLLIIDRDEDGTIAARRRAAAAALASVAESPRDVLRARARVRPNRTGTGGLAHLRLTRATHPDESPGAVAARAELEGLADSMSLRLTRRDSSPRRGGRAL